jgi:hypothetical protein
MITSTITATDAGKSMVERIIGNIELLLTEEEVELADKQVAAQNSGDVFKSEADYQNEPHNGDQCSDCDMFVPGFTIDVGGYCRKVHSFRGPQGIIFEDGWCKFFEKNTARAMARSG